MDENEPKPGAAHGANINFSDLDPGEQSKHRTAQKDPILRAFGARSDMVNARRSPPAAPSNFAHITPAKSGKYAVADGAGTVDSL